jgi:large subunit ribosomal protein L1
MPKKKEELTEVTPEVTEESPEVAEEVAETETAEATEEKPVKAEKKEKTAKKASHSVKHQESVAVIDKSVTYPIAEAIELVKKSSYTKFDGSLDVHVRFNTGKKSDEIIRGMVTLPHGTGKERKVIVITDEYIEKIEKGWLDFDVAIATPDMMPKLAKLAKILGPKGLMPSPKSGTVTTEPDRVIEELKGGRVEFKTDSLNIVHQPIGKVSWDAAKLIENFDAFLGALPKTRIKSVSIAPTMGAAARVNY